MRRCTFCILHMTILTTHVLRLLGRLVALKMADVYNDEEHVRGLQREAAVYGRGLDVANLQACNHQHFKHSADALPSLQGLVIPEFVSQRHKTMHLFHSQSVPVTLCPQVGCGYAYGGTGFFIATSLIEGAHPNKVRLAASSQQAAASEVGNNGLHACQLLLGLIRVSVAGPAHAAPCRLPALRHPPRKHHN
jgi:hypothetical protein